LHVRIRGELEDRLTRGVYSQGDLMPTEVELAREFDTSRFTIREALRWLGERGYVERRQGVGTRVVSDRPRSNYTLSVGSLEELFQVAQDTRFAIDREERVRLDAVLAEMVGGEEGEDWLRLEGVRLTVPEGRPICFVQSYVPIRFAGLLPQIRRLRGPIFALLERTDGAPVELTVQEITALPMPADIARALGRPEGDWALRLLRRYVAQPGVLITSLNWHPAETMTYRMEIRSAAPADRAGA
jgi:DNA-binding GntR family transcriptional regulator